MARLEGRKPNTLAIVGGAIVVAAVAAGLFYAFSPAKTEPLVNSAAQNSVTAPNSASSNAAQSEAEGSETDVVSGSSTPLPLATASAAGNAAGQVSNAPDNVSGAAPVTPAGTPGGAAMPAAAMPAPTTGAPMAGAAPTAMPQNAGSQALPTATPVPVAPVVIATPQSQSGAAPELPNGATGTALNQRPVALRPQTSSQALNPAGVQRAPAVSVATPAPPLSAPQGITPSKGGY